MSKEIQIPRLWGQDLFEIGDSVQALAIMYNRHGTKIDAGEIGTIEKVLTSTSHVKDPRGKIHIRSTQFSTKLNTNYVLFKNISCSY